MKKQTAIAVLLLCLVSIRARVDAQHTPDWGSGVAPFAFALIGDMPYGAARETPFTRLVDEINRDSDVDFVVHAGDIKAGSERCDDSLILRRFALYQNFERAFVFTPGDNEWTDCHRANNGGYNPLERLAYLRSVSFPQPGQTTGGKVRPVQTQAASGEYSEFVENVMFRKHGVVFATAHVVGSNDGFEPWSGIDPADSCTTPNAARLAEVQRRQAAVRAWLDEVFAAAAGSRAVFLLIQASPYNLPSNPALCPAGFTAFLEHLEALADEYDRPVMLAHGDDHFFFMDQPLANRLFSRVQTYGESQVHWLKVHVDPKSSGVFSIEQQIVRANR